MAEAYTHVRTALRAYHRSGLSGYALSPLATGANGPDPLFVHHFWAKNAHLLPSLPAMGQTIHLRRTGLFLVNLAKNATTATQRAYVLGFFCHYATDVAIHPFIEAMITGDGPLAHLPGAHGFLEAGLDSILAQKDTGNPIVQQGFTAPFLPRAAGGEIGLLLAQTISNTFGEDISPADLQQALAMFRQYRRITMDQTGFKKRLGRVLDRHLMGKKNFFVSHLTPGIVLPALPSTWQNPYNDQWQKTSVFDLIELAQNQSIRYFKAADDFWQGRIQADDLAEILGNLSYDSGLISGD